MCQGPQIPPSHPTCSWPHIQDRRWKDSAVGSRCQMLQPWINSLTYKLCPLLFAVCHFSGSQDPALKVRRAGHSSCCSPLPSLQHRWVNSSGKEGPAEGGLVQGCQRYGPGARPSPPSPLIQPLVVLLGFTVAPCKVLDRPHMKGPGCRLHMAPIPAGLRLRRVRCLL